MNRLFLLMVFFATSCNLTSRTNYGVKKQKAESPERIKGWLVNHKLNPETVFAIAPESYIDYTISTQNAPLLFDRISGRFLAIGFNNGVFSPKEPEKLFYNILPYSTIKFKPDSFLLNKTTSIPPGASIKDKSKYITKYDTIVLNLKNVFHSFTTLNGDINPQIPESAADYILIIPFAIYWGDKIQLENITNYYYSALNNRFSKISIVFLNLDKQIWWSEEWKNTNTMKYH